MIYFSKVGSKCKKIIEEFLTQKRIYGQINKKNTSSYILRFTLCLKQQSFFILGVRNYILYLDGAHIPKIVKSLRNINVYIYIYIS